MYFVNLKCYFCLKSLTFESVELDWHARNDGRHVLALMTGTDGGTGWIYGSIFEIQEDAERG